MYRVQVSEWRVKLFGSIGFSFRVLGLGFGLRAGAKCTFWNAFKKHGYTVASY